MRIGGEITELAEKDRRLIADMAQRMPEAGSEAERRNGAAPAARDAPVAPIPPTGDSHAARTMPILAVRACTHAARRISEGGLSVRVFTNQRGSVASELSFGAMVVGILVLGGLYMVAQIEGVSFSMLLQQLRSG